MGTQAVAEPKQHTTVSNTDYNFSATGSLSLKQDQ